MSMTYKINPEVSKIESPIVLVFPNGEKKSYHSGIDVAEAAFDRRYIISTLKAVDDKIEIDLLEPVLAGSNWIGEEQTFF